MPYSYVIGNWGQVTSTRLSELVYSPYSPIVTDKEYNYGVTLNTTPSTTYLVRETDSEYIINTGGQLGNTVVELSGTQVGDWSSGAYIGLSGTSYNYDQTSTTPTTNTPQHLAVVGGGNVTSQASFVSSSTTLYKVFTYYDTGNLQTATDFGTTSVGGPNVTTYNYDNSGAPPTTPSCGNSFVTSISEPLSLTPSYTWNCIGGVMLTATDPNGKTTTADYTTDHYFWRPDYTLDQLNYKTTLAYTGQTAAESNLTFNSNHSVSDFLTTVDGFGRPILNQRAQTPSPTEYDSSETDYNVMGQPSRSTMLFQAAASTTSSSASGTTTVYDALGRPTLVTDSGGGTISYLYTNNDVLQTVGPTQNFKKQFEYDGLGRLTSVCEITSATGSATCGQTNSQTGFWTRYKYDALGNLTAVCQNTTVPLATDCVKSPSASQQTRTYAYDGLSRLTSETNPESGTTQYFYDSYSGVPSSAGDLIAVVKQNLDASYFYYDALHRPTDVGRGGPDSYYCKRFRYDNTANGIHPVPSGATLANSVGRVVEAETDTCTNSYVVITDEWFSYDADGNPTDVYESTPHSGGYYHTSALYWPNGGLDTLGLFSSTGASMMPTQTYGADGEGRPSTVSAASGQNPVTAVTYTLSGTTEPIGSLTNVTFGSQDSDSYQYDPTTGRTTQYTLKVNGQSVVGKLKWNPNGTLQQLTVTDLIDSQNNQTCTDTYDDLARLSGNSCATNVWAQTFSYDPFGNINKSGSISWQPNYATPANNQYLAGWNGVSYDTNGNLKNDTFNTYTWDVYGNVASVNSIAIIYDALGRQAEQQSGSNYKQFIYSPTGQKLAWASGQTLGSAWVQLPGGAGVVYTPGGIALYRHPDWLGSVRATSTGASPTSAYSDVAYAPFGEPYSVLSGISYAAFTGQNQDTILGLTDFPFREYSPTQGRWISPDPAGLAAVDPTNPQTWNRYAYVMNQPLSFIDPSGLKPVYVCITWTVSTDNDTSAAPGASGQDCNWYDDGTGDSPNAITPSCPAGAACPTGPANNGSCANYVMANCGAANNPNLTLTIVRAQGTCLGQVQQVHTQAMNDAQRSLGQTLPNLDWAAIFSMTQLSKVGTGTVSQFFGGVANAATTALGMRALYFVSKAGVQTVMAEGNFVGGYAQCASLGAVGG